MGDSEPSGDVSRFIAQFVSSIEHVEVLRQLYGPPRRTIPCGDLATRTHIDQGTIEQIARDLGPAGVKRDSSGALRLASSGGHTRVIAALLDAYNIRPLTVVEAIRARATSTGSLADALIDLLEP